MKTLLMMLVMVATLMIGASTNVQANCESSAVSAPADGGINFFQGTWSEALAAAKKQKKLIFVDAYAVWCGPCKYMTNAVFTDKAVGEYYNKSFVNYKFDMEKGEGTVFAKKYTVNSYPSLIFISPEGKSVYFAEGIHEADAFMKLAKAANEIFAKQ